MNTNKVEELINVIDPDKYQCYKCKKWRDQIYEHKQSKSIK